MIKAKRIGLILDKEILIEATMKNGIVIGVACEFVDAEYDRLYLRFPANKEQLIQYFYEDRTIDVSLDTLDGRRVYSAKILYEPSDNLLVVEYYDDENIAQKRKILRVRATRFVDIMLDDKPIKLLTIDISAGGCRLLSSEKLGEGNYYLGQLQLDPQEASLPVKMKIHSCKYLSVENKYEITSEFVEIKEVDSKKIMKFCYDVQAEALFGKNRLQ